MLQIEIKSSFVELGNFLRQFSEEGNVKSASVLHNDLFFDDFTSLIELSQSHNGWFTPEQVQFSVQSWSKALTEDNLNQLGCWKLSPVLLRPLELQNIGVWPAPTGFG